MKTRLFAVAAVLALAVLASGGAAQAQQQLQVNVPFDFVAGAATLPAGEYSVGRLSHLPVVLVRKIGAPAASAMAITNPGQPKVGESRSLLVFQRYGRDYFLSQIWSAEDQVCMALIFKPSRAREPELAKSNMPDQITLVAYRAPAK